MKLMMRKLTLLHIVLISLVILSVQPQWTALAGTQIQVNTTADEINNDGDCSLREAIQAANTNLPVDACPAGVFDSPDDILIPSGTYTLSVPGTSENEGLTGDLDITESVNLLGSGTGTTILNANHIDRVLEISGSTTVNISRLTITGGMAPFESSQSRGGGLLVKGSTVTLERVMVRNNQASTSGGGIDNFGGRLTITDSTLRENQALRGGGVYNGNSLVITRSLVAANTASQNGGGVDNFDTAVLENATFSGNSAGNNPETGDGLGGGIFSDGIVSMVNVTMRNNTGAAFNNEGEGRLVNVIMAANGPANCVGPITSEGHNIEDKNTCSFNGTGDQPDTAPLLESLENNGGYTLTFALQQLSPAIDQGDPSRCPEVDQRGAWRPADGDGNGSAICDIGSFEHDAIFGNLYLPLVKK